MIEVQALNEDGERVGLRFDTNAIEVIHGALIVYSTDAKNFLAGFAPGEWLTFQNLGA